MSPEVRAPQPQRLPIKLSRVPTRGDYAPWRPGFWRRSGTRLMLAAGLLLAAAGARLGTYSPSGHVAQAPDAYQVGTDRIPGGGAGGRYVYHGDGAVVVEHEGGRTRAGASATWNGQHLWAVCLADDRETTEHCLFSLDHRTVAATDSAVPGGWRRRYEDGQQVLILTDGRRPVPVPFPIGRS